VNGVSLALACEEAERKGIALGHTQALAPLYALVDEQAEDEALWSTRLDGTLSAGEAYLQQGLRRLHTLIESGREETTT
jgi:hypothetical protein